MKKLSVQALVPEKKKDGKVVQKQLGPCVAEVDCPETLDEARKMFGEEAVLSNAISKWKVTLQSNIRSGLRSGLTPKQIQEKLAHAKMGVALAGGRIDPEQAFLAKFASATPEEQAKMIADLKKAAQEA